MKVFGQELSSLLNQLRSLGSNLLAWLQSFFVSREVKNQDQSAILKLCTENKPLSVVVVGAGGLDRLQYASMPMTSLARTQRMSVGYNVPGYKAPFADVPIQATSFQENTGEAYADIYDLETSHVNHDLIVVHIEFFSINYADVCIRYGLYESALLYVGWPIVPGFDFSGVIVSIGPNVVSKSGLRVGDKVFGYTMFGSYSNLLLVPCWQVRKSPESYLSQAQLASIPAVAGTALHSLSLAGAWPNKLLSRNKAALIHSAAGGVGSMLVQMCKLCGYSPVVAVVGSSHKVQYCKDLGADYVIDKSKQNLWKEATSISPEGYVSIFDANGIETLQQSYDHLSRCGRLISYGFHTNIPKTRTILSPLSVLAMIYNVMRMPKFDLMPMVLESKSIAGFNLSFFADEHELINEYMKQMLSWIESGSLKVSSITTLQFQEVRQSHEILQSGKTTGKLIIQTN